MASRGWTDLGVADNGLHMTAVHFHVSRSNYLQTSTALTQVDLLMTMTSELNP